VVLTAAARAVAAMVLLLLPPAVAPVRAEGDVIDYRPPVDAPVVDGFRLPDGPFGAGNRGLEYATTAGTVARAIGPGTVTFAGQVGGHLHVTVRHPDGLRSSYSFLAAVDVQEGERVQRGDRVGTTAGRLHLGVRRGVDYIDPAGLFGSRRARLIPTPHR
jgi:murein DD-endopeptidase MepM/ murein hydrolase activator NlpD